MNEVCIENGEQLCFWCPACNTMHSVGSKRWSWNGSFTTPNLSPSVKMTWGPFPDDSNRAGQFDCCHYFVRDGRIEYCGDCTHSMAGKTVPLPTLESVILILPSDRPGVLGWVRKTERVL